MKAFHFVEHKGKKIGVVDLSDIKSGTDAVPILQEAQKQISSQAPKSALILTDATNSTYDRASSSAIKEFASKNTPFVKASAVVGADGLRAVLLKTVALITRREIKLFKSRPEAMDWLVNVT
jgi:hypothetical protein